MGVIDRTRSNIDNQVNIGNGEVSLSRWDSVHAMELTTSPRFAFSIKRTCNMEIDSFSCIWKRLGTVKVQDFKTEFRNSKLIGLSDKEVAIVNFGSDIKIYNVETNTLKTLSINIPALIDFFPEVVSLNTNYIYLQLDKLYKIDRNEYNFTVASNSLTPTGAATILPNAVIEGDTITININNPLSAIGQLSFTQPQYMYTNYGIGQGQFPTGIYTSHIENSRQGDIIYNSPLSLSGLVIFNKNNGDYIDNGVLTVSNGFDIKSITTQTPVSGQNGHITVSGISYIQSVYYNKTTDISSGQMDLRATTIDFTGNYPTTITLKLISGVSTVTTSGTSGSNKNLDFPEKTAILNNRFFVFKNQKIYFSNTGDFNTFDPSNVISMPQMGTVIAVKQFSNEILFSDGKQLFSINQINPISQSSPFEYRINYLGEYNIVPNGIINVHNQVLTVTRQGIFGIQLSGVLYGELSGKIVSDIIPSTLLCSHFFDYNISHVMSNPTDFSFYMIKENNEVVHFQKKYEVDILVGTTLFFGHGSNISTDHSGYFGFILQSVYNYHSLLYFPRYTPTYGNINDRHTGFRRFYNIRNYLDAATYITSDYYHKFIKNQDGSFKTSFEIEERRPFDIPKHLFMGRSDLKVGDTLVYINKDENIMRGKVTEITPGAFKIDYIDPSIEVGDKIQILGIEVRASEFTSEQIDFYKDFDNVYICVDTGENIEVLEFNEDNLKYAKGISISIGFGYKAFFDFAPNKTFERHVKLRGLLGLNDGYEVEFYQQDSMEYKELHKIDNKKGSYLRPFDIYFPNSNAYYTSFPLLGLRFTPGLSGCITCVNFVIE